MKPPKGFEWSDYRIAFQLLAVLVGVVGGLILAMVAAFVWFPK